MSRIIAVANQKGGVGKTTTAVNLSACLAQKGQKVLAVDMDPQGNASSGLGVDKNILPKTIYNLLLNECYIEEILTKTPVNGLLLLPANVNLAGAEIELIDRPNREYTLKKILDNAKYLYDFVIIDCPPSLNILTLNAMTAADSVLVPIQCEYYALEGLTQLLHTIELVQKKLNPYLAIEGVVFTMFDSRTNLSMQVVDEVKRHLGKNVYRSIIPRNVRLSEAPSHGIPITMYDEKSKGAEGYIMLAEEVMEGPERNRRPEGSFSRSEKHEGPERNRRPEGFEKAGFDESELTERNKKQEEPEANRKPAGTERRQGLFSRKRKGGGK